MNKMKKSYSRDECRRCGAYLPPIRHQKLPGGYMQVKHAMKKKGFCLNCSESPRGRSRREWAMHTHDMRNAMRDGILVSCIIPAEYTDIKIKWSLKMPTDVEEARDNE